MSSLQFRLTDFIVLFLVVAATVFCAMQVYGNNGSALHVVIQGRNGSWVYPINQTVQIDVPGPLGLTTVALKDGTAQVIASPCANQTCVTSGHVQKGGQWIACLPNAVFVRVESRDSMQPKKQDAKLDGAVW